VRVHEPGDDERAPVREQDPALRRSLGGVMERACRHGRPGRKPGAREVVESLDPPPVDEEEPFGEAGDDERHGPIFPHALASAA
jgi:hypothetical protein